MTYTPTTEEVREGYAESGLEEKTYLEQEHTRKLNLAEFDRWLEAHDREVKAQALEEAADEWVSRAWEANLIGVHKPSNGTKVMHWLRDRAQQLKG